MKILFIGGGGRAHAILWKALHSHYVTEAFSAPGNAGIAMERTLGGKPVICVPINPTDIHALLAWAKEHKPDLTIVQEDRPLALGIVDLFQQAGLIIWGPTKRAFQFESSKIWAHKFMERYGIPHPIGKACYSEWETLNFAEALGWQCVIKADGLMDGKGAKVCHTKEMVAQAITQLFGPEGAQTRVLVQKLEEGNEVSLHYLCSGESATAFQSSTDYKRECDGGLGENTGGLGTVSPSPDITEEEYRKISETIITPWLVGCKAEGIDFRGILYPGVMLTKEGPKVLEFNARFGDTETQTYLTRLDHDLLPLIQGSLDGMPYQQNELRWREQISVCVVMASPGYPRKHETGKLITGLDIVAKMPDVKVIHAGTKLGDDGKVYTNGGRVLGVTAWGGTLEIARVTAYQAVRFITFEGGQHFRKDIGGPPLWD